MSRTSNAVLVFGLGLLLTAVLAFNAAEATPESTARKSGDGQPDVLCPRIYCPDDLTVECSESLDPSNTGEPTISSAARPYTVTYEDVVVEQGNCPYNYVIRRRWRVVDGYGHSATCDQMITVEDTTPPEITCPTDKFFSCESIGDFGVASAVDNCDPEPRLDYDDEITCRRCDYAYTIVRTWTATDACGNTSTCQQRIQISDNIAPEIICPPDIIAHCDQVVDFGEATAEDNCDPGPVITFEDTRVPGGCEYEYTIQRIWRATDQCGNFSTCLQTIRVVDMIPPEITCPADETFECDDIGYAGEATATYLDWLYSNCGGRFLQSPAPTGPTSDSEGEAADEAVSEMLPERLELTVRPNPLQVGTSIQLALPAGADVSLDIYDVQGRKVAALMSGRLGAGYHTTDWKGSDEHGNRVSAGAYFCRLRVNGQPMLMQKLMKL